MTRSHRIVSCAVVLASLAFASAAWAQPRVAVLGISGPGGPQARAGLVRALSGELELVEASEWREAARRLGVRGSGAETYARVAVELGVAAVVVGSVSRAGRRGFTLGVAVRDGADGRVLGRASRSMRNLGGAGASGAGVAARVLELAGEAAGPGAAPAPRPAGSGGDPSPSDDGGAEMDWTAGPDGAAGPGGPVVAQALDPELTGEPVAAGSGAGPSRPSSSGGSSPAPGLPGGWLELAIAVPVASRSFTVSIDSERDTLGRPGAEVASGVYPELGLRAAFFPVALFRGGWPAGFGLEASFQHDVGLRLVQRSQSGAEQEIAASEYMLSLGVVYRACFGTESRGATVQGALGWSRASFFLGDVHNDLVPPFVYDALHLLAAAHVPFGTARIGVDLAAGYLGALSIGAVAAMAYNASGVYPSSNGFRVLVGLSGRVWRGLRWRLAFELSGFVTSHTGPGRGFGTDPSTVVGVEGAQGIDPLAPTVDLFWRLVPELLYRFGEGHSPRRGPGGRTGTDGPSEDWLVGGEGGEAAAEEPSGAATAPAGDPEGWLETD